VVGIGGTTTIRASARTLTKTQPQAVPSVSEAVAIVKDGRADAFALPRDSLAPVRNEVPGSRIVTGGFQQTSVSVAVPRSGLPPSPSRQPGSPRPRRTAQSRASSTRTASRRSIAP
jgi:polar amino acid transport system substrate-binding protein